MITETYSASVLIIPTLLWGKVTEMHLDDWTIAKLLDTIILRMLSIIEK